MLEHATPDTFLPHAGTTFRAGAPTRPVDLRLADLHRYPAQPQGPRREPFALVFTGPADLPLGQGLYELEHPALGVLALFLVPIGPGDDGLPRYEAVLN